MAALQGDTFDPAPVRIVENPLVGLFTITYPTRPPVTCRERIVPPPDTPTVSAQTGGIVFFNTLHLREDLVLPDYTRLEDGTRALAAAMFFAHEMTHVWQWQNRDITNYHPFRAFWEHATIDDQYLFDNDDPRSFLAYGYEQQAALVEECVCCSALEPDGARTKRLERLISQVMPVEPLQSRVDTTPIRIPWEDAPLKGSAPNAKPSDHHGFGRDWHPDPGCTQRAPWGQYRLTRSGRHNPFRRRVSNGGDHRDGHGLEPLRALPSQPKHLFLAGVLIAFYVLSITFIAPTFGVGNAVFFVLLGQLISAAAIDHFGLFGAQVTPINALRILGIAVMAAGVAITQLAAR